MVLNILQNIYMVAMTVVKTVLRFFSPIMRPRELGNRLVHFSLREKGGIRGSKVTFSLQHDVLLADKGQKLC